MNINKQQIAAALPFAHKESSRYAMQAVRVFSGAGWSTAEATNGKQLIRATFRDGEMAESEGGLVPSDCAKSILKLAPKGRRARTEFALSFTDGRVRVEGTTSPLDYPEVEGHYPPTDEVWIANPDGVEVGLAVGVLENLVKSLKAAKLDTVRLTVKDAKSAVHFVARAPEQVTVEGLLMPVNLA